MTTTWEDVAEAAKGISGDISDTVRGTDFARLEEYGPLQAALINWFLSQEVPVARGGNAMTLLVGEAVGSSVSNHAELRIALNSIVALLSAVATMAFARRQHEDKTSGR